jgi:pantoate--beta-alanine ligase
LTHRAFVALGSNLGDRWSYLEGAVRALPDVAAVSPVYETDPVGGPPGQGPYLNAVVRLDTDLGARRLLEEAQGAEMAAGRRRRERWGPRTLDVDVIWVDGETVDQPDLVVPHPRLWERAFVLVPLADLAPDIAGAAVTPEVRRSVRVAGTISATTGTGAPPGRTVSHQARGPVAPHPIGVTIRLVTDPADWRRALDEQRAQGRTVGLVPTMGAVHAGHLSLIRRAAAQCDVVAMTDYVNPLQFGPAEDLDAYPRDVDGDCRLAAAAGAHLVFAPSPAQMWATPPATTVHPGPPADELEGRFRPGHFDGVATIVTKLLALSGPCWAYFGEKDWQQLVVVRRLVSDLSLPAAVVGCPTVRHEDGLALSSRNSYLTGEERDAAPRLYYALLAGRRAVERGEDDPRTVQKVMAEAVAAEPRFRVDYLEVADPELLTTPPRLAGDLRLLGAARIGATRLIDNIGATSPHPVTER